MIRLMGVPAVYTFYSRWLEVAALVFLSLFISARAHDLAPLNTMVSTCCLDCHDADSEKGKVDLEALLDQEVGKHAEIWEKVVRQWASRQMPPMGKDRPGLAVYDTASAALIKPLDACRRGRAPPAPAEKG